MVIVLEVAVVVVAGEEGQEEKQAPGAACDGNVKWLGLIPRVAGNRTASRRGHLTALCETHAPILGSLSHDDDSNGMG